MLYSQDADVVFYATFKKLTGEAASVSGTPTITITKIKNGSSTTIVNSTNMSQLGSSSTYYYEYHVPAAATKTTYVAKYSANYADGTSVIGSDEFFVADRNLFKGSGGHVKRPKEWTEKDKEKLFNLITNLSNDFEKISNVISKVDSQTKINEKVGRMAKNSLENLESLENEFKQLFRLQEKDLETQKTQKKDIVNGLENVSENLKTIKTTLNKDTNKDVRNKLNELTKDLETVSKLVIKQADSEKLEEYLNEED